MIRFALVVFIVGALTPKFAPAEQLVSIRGIDLKNDEYISGIEIHTWAVRIRAVCAIPHGWKITAGNEIDPGGELAGGATGFVANLNVKQIRDLENLFLIDDPKPNDYLSPNAPPMFEGSMSTGTYRHPEAGEHDRRLEPGNLVLTPATGCPRPQKS